MPEAEVGPTEGHGREECPGVKGAACGGDSLRSAVEQGLVDRVGALLDEGGDCGADLGSGVTLLHIAAQANQPGVAAILLARGANPNAMTRANWTPLHVAARTGHSEVAQVLLSHGALADAVTNQGHTPLALAVINQNKEIAQVLKKATRKWWHFW